MYGWLMLPHPLNTKLFLLTGCLKALLRDTPARRSRFQVQDNFPVIINMQKVAEQRSIKTALSYDLFILIITKKHFWKKMKCDVEMIVRYVAEIRYENKLGMSSY